jgi:hypothetical protein
LFIGDITHSCNGSAPSTRVGCILHSERGESLSSS